MSSATGLILLVVITWVQAGIRLGHVCENDLDCNNIVDAECSNGVCSCVESTVVYKGACVQAAQPETPCVRDVDCKSLTDTRQICVDSQCRCIPLHHVLDGICTRDKGLQEFCLSDDECYWGQDMADKMECVGSVCACKSGYQPINGRQCVSTGGTFRSAVQRFISLLFG